MDIFTKSFVIIVTISYCTSASLRDRLQNIARRRQDDLTLNYKDLPSRRFNNLEIIRSPSRPSDLPAAEPILPGHTLLRPALGMLKSAVKFPHRDPDNGAWVNGNIDNLGIRYGGRDDRVLYSGFRRMSTDYDEVAPLQKETYRKPSVILIIPNKDTVFTLKRVLRLLQNAVHKKQSLTKQDIYSDLERLSHGYEYYGLDPLIRHLRSFREERDDKKELWIKKLRNDNHVIIDQDAPDINDFVPLTSTKKLRERWWYYNQDDFHSFTD